MSKSSSSSLSKQMSNVHIGEPNSTSNPPGQESEDLIYEASDLAPDESNNQSVKGGKARRPRSKSKSKSKPKKSKSPAKKKKTKKH